MDRSVSHGEDQHHIPALFDVLSLTVVIDGKWLYHPDQCRRCR